MESDTVLDYALFQLSPRRTRCELFASGNGKAEKLASGFLKPFVTHLKVAEEQASQAVQSIRLEVDKRKNGSKWFNKGTLERFVRFVSTPEVLELVNTFDAEMSQLEGARKIYSQGAGDQLSGASGENDAASAAAADKTKKELLKAIDVRLVAVKQDLATACARATAAGFTLDSVSELLLFADRFGALRLNEACTKFISLCQRRPELISHQNLPPPSLPPQWRGFDDANIRSSSGSDMSIDEGDMESAGAFKPPSSGGGGTEPEFHKPGSGQPPQQTTAEPSTAFQLSKPLVLSLVDDSNKAKEDPAPKAASLAEPAQPVGGGSSRRLSVQDRINLFESKQKEQSTSASISSSTTGSGGITRAVVGKPEHRRLPSDVSVEKSVLRRWSGASDMSIDLNNNSCSSDRRDSGSAAGTPTSHSQAQSDSRTEDKEAGGLKDTATSRSWTALKNNPVGSSSSLSSSQAQARAFPKDRDRVEDVLLREGTATTSKAQSGQSLEKELGDSKTQFNASLSRGQQGIFSDQVASQTRSKATSDSGEGAGLKDQGAILTQLKAVSEQHIGMKEQATLQTPSRADPTIAVRAEQKDLGSFRSKAGDQAGDDGVGVKNQATTVGKFRTFASKTEAGGGNSRGLFDSQTQIQVRASSGKEEGIAHKNDILPSLPQRTIPGKQEDVVRKEAIASHVQFKAFSVGVEEDSGPQGMKLRGRTSASDQTRKLQGRRDERVTNQGSGMAVFPGKKNKEGVEVLDPPSTSSMEQVQVVRPSKGNLELNDELQMKANELEKLFAAHKLRVQGDQIASSRRSKPVDNLAPKAMEKRPEEAPPDQFQVGSILSESASNGVEFDASSLLKMVDNWDYSNSIRQKIGNLSPSDDYRGKLYEKYMQKRDAKLREEWGSNRAQKEAKMKAMHDSLERSQAEMKTKFTGFVDVQDQAHARRRAEKMRSFNARSAIKNKEQTLESIHGEGDEDLQELPEQVHHEQDRSYSDVLSGNESSTSIHSKKLISSKSLSSSTPRTSINPIPRPSVKVTNSGSIRRRAQPENPLAQSVPNFSDFRKENTKPSSGLSKVTPRAQSRTFARSKSTTEEAILVKEEKPRRSHSMRKSSASPGELKDLSPLSSDGANLTQLKFSKDQMEQAVKFQKSGESKPFLRKGNGTGPGAGSGVAKLKASMSREVLKDEEASEGLVDLQEDSPEIVMDDEEEFDRTSAEGHLQTTDFHVDSDSEKPKLSQESGDSDNPGSENGDVLRSLSQADDDSTAACSKFNPAAGNVQESPGESPGSWNSHIHHSFSYTHEASDIDVSMDSPTGSPASWNSHPLNQMMEADAARMRKKWGSAQIPILVANAPHSSRKDVTKGFKRLLKFGRKSRGTDLVTDWVSASTASEGDDDTEDGRDLANRSSEDLRKSRMGYSIPAYDGFNEGDIFADQVQSLRSSIPNPPANFKLREDHLSGSSLKAPRSFFSLSSFRSKGSESKPR